MPRKAKVKERFVKPEGYQPSYTFEYPAPGKTSVYYRGNYVGEMQISPNFNKTFAYNSKTNGGPNHQSILVATMELYPHYFFKTVIQKQDHRNLCVAKKSKHLESFFNGKIIQSLEPIIPGITGLYWFWYKDTLLKHRAEVFPTLLGVAEELKTNPYFMKDLYKYKFLRQFILHRGQQKLYGTPLSKWREWFLDKSANRRAMNLTIDGWKWHSKALYDFNETHLSRITKPIDNRTKLYFVQSLIPIEYHGGTQGGLRIREAIEHSDVKDIRKAAKLLRNAEINQGANRYAQLASQYKLNSVAGVQNVIRYLSDYLRGEQYEGTNIVGLTKRAIEWHTLFQRRNQEQQTQRYLANRPPETPTAVPPFEIDIEGITRLSTLQAIMDEGAKMKHCVASYANMAADGMCYLYHIEHNGEMATAEIGFRYVHDPKVSNALLTYELRQCQGPRNQPNSASLQGALVLGMALANINLELKEKHYADNSIKDRGDTGGVDGAIPNLVRDDNTF